MLSGMLSVFGLGLSIIIMDKAKAHFDGKVLITQWVNAVLLNIGTPGISRE